MEKVGGVLFSVEGESVGVVCSCSLAMVMFAMSLIILISPGKGRVGKEG